MKKIILILAALLTAFAAFSETKTFYFTRHGQRGDPKYQKKFQFCDEDALMPKGEEQAKLLGQYLNSKGFKGTIYVSPYYRTLQTASIAASQLPEIPMILEPRCQETSSIKNSSGKPYTIKKCMTRKEIKENFPAVKIPKGMKFPWRLDNERESQKDQRISDMIDALEKTEGDVFVVCHGGIMSSVIREMEKRGADFPRRKVYNCCLYIFTVDTDTGKVTGASDETINYLPDELITDNLAFMLTKPKRD